MAKKKKNRKTAAAGKENNKAPAGKKAKFTVEEGETVAGCLQRMNAAGYTPVRRMEEPVLMEVERGGKNEVEVSHQKIVFEGKKMEE
ncbi:NETI motif-containing protein [Alteribacter natronophilus]|uniref:NETI motif-containing protein n=1 Tax=Alteribacter natronophilus TaxID=2583810 RepID=UPI00110EE217|nr:NETI motif-containing protein [Alteribacter natronophilus]TMW71096.1 NETI motif-containing protein [Alteribacter natronophilus]